MLLSRVVVSAAAFYNSEVQALPLGPQIVRWHSNSLVRSSPVYIVLPSLIRLRQKLFPRFRPVLASESSLTITAINMLTFKGHNVWITMGDAGTHATEFSIETDSDEKTVTCWIASEVGKVSTKPPLCVLDTKYFRRNYCRLLL